jgi:EAL domain-containing protein (putative c-di-GMP-specific phosphodiesterase class I)
MSTITQLNTAPDVPFLVHYPEPGGVAQRIPITVLPFRLGRSSRSNHVIYSSQVSKEHAEIYCVGEEIHVRDLGSTNGTFVNGERVANAPLNDGDIVHLAQKEFQFRYKPDRPMTESNQGITDSVTSQVPFSILCGKEALKQLLARRSVCSVFQPIVDLESLAVMGYEALGRGAHEQLSPQPANLFRLAEHWKLAAELSRLFRQAALQDALKLPGNPRIFFNVHPTEMESKVLLDSLKEVPSALRDNQRIVLEVHEDLAADSVSLGQLRDQLHQEGISLAYDDFGAGQARLMELAEAPPHFIKLDMALIRHIEQAKPRQELVQALCRVSDDLGVLVIAEGIETKEEAETCHRLGCTFGQGYLFACPQPATFFAEKRKSDTRLVDRRQLLALLKERQAKLSTKATS